jgi:hypothetical protein
VHNRFKERDLKKYSNRPPHSFQLAEPLLLFGLGLLGQLLGEPPPLDLTHGALEGEPLPLAPRFRLSEKSERKNKERSSDKRIIVKVHNRIME